VFAGSAVAVSAFENSGPIEFKRMLGDGISGLSIFPPCFFTHGNLSIY